MPREKETPTGGAASNETAESATTRADGASGDARSDRRARTEDDAEREGSLDRRAYLKGLGVTATALGGLATSASLTQAATNGPPNPDDWQLAFEDSFDGGALDTAKWDVGFGWGLNTNNSAESIASSQVAVTDGSLHLSAEHDYFGSVEAGAINTKDKHTFGPGSYWEARIEMPKREGFLPAFWAKSNTEAWPPELDFVELFQNSGTASDWTNANYNVHYSTSTEPGDGSTHAKDPTHHATGQDLTQDFHVYGCKWLTDRIEFFFDGQKVGECTDATALSALKKGAPFYMMLNIHVDKIGVTDKSEPWPEEMVVDWVRVWDHDPDSGTDSGGSTDGSTQEHYLWPRSADGNPVTFAFEASGGNVRLDSSGFQADYWIADDGTTAGGTTAKRIDLPGFWFEGEITDLRYDGALELYLDDALVDPDTFVDASEPGPSKPRSYANTLTVDGSGASTTASYSVSVSDAIGPATELDAEDAISGSTATGSVGSDVDEYGFDGSLTALSVDGDAEVRVNGTALDRLRVSRAEGSSGTVTYLVETTGGVQGLSPSVLDGSDQVRGPKIFGTVTDGVDYYWLSDSTVVDVSTFGGSVVTELNGTVIDRTD